MTMELLSTGCPVLEICPVYVDACIDFFPVKKILLKLENWAFMSMPTTASAGDVTCNDVNAEIKAHSFLSCQYALIHTS